MVRVGERSENVTYSSQSSGFASVLKVLMLPVKYQNTITWLYWNGDRVAGPRGFNLDELSLKIVQGIDSKVPLVYSLKQR